jgi:seryl-tRNA synthetase
MLDIRFIRDNAQAVQQNAINKGYKVSIADLLNVDEERRNLQFQVDELRQSRNNNVASIKGKPTDEQILEGKNIKEKLAELEPKLKEVDDSFLDLLKNVPNMAFDDVPVGSSEDDSVVIKVVGEPTKFDFKPLNHAEIAAIHGWIDKERAAKVTGSRFAYIKGDMVKLQFAIIQFVINTLSDESIISKVIEKAGLTGLSTRPFVPILPPLMIRTEVYDAMDRLEPRDQRYKIEGDELWMQGSAEHVLGSMYYNETFQESDLPIRYIGYASSFRREAGTYGKDMEGIFRVHQFDKLEIESFSTAENGFNEHLLFVAVQEYMLGQLELPYRVLQKCTFDIGKPNARGVDMEVFLPGQGKYRETHTADYMTDYQARRLNTRVKRNSGETELIHTNDATAFALGRIMIAIIENNQTADGHVKIPKVLQPYLGERDIL